MNTPLELPALAVKAAVQAGKIANLDERILMVTVDGDFGDGFSMLEVFGRPDGNVDVGTYADEDDDGHHHRALRVTLDPEGKEVARTPVLTREGLLQRMVEKVTDDLRANGHDVSAADILDSLATHGYYIEEGHGAAHAYRELLRDAPIDNA